MSIAQADKSALIIAITDAIQDGSTTRTGVIKIPDKWEEDTIKQFDEETRKRFKKTLDDGGLSSFIKNEIQNYVFMAGDKLPRVDAPLSNLQCLSDPLNVARFISDIAQAIPKQYRFIVRGSAELAFRLKRSDINYKISDQLTLLSGKLLPGTFKLSHPIDLINEHLRRDSFEKGKTFQVDEDGLYFEYRCSGYIGNRTDTRLSRDLFDQIRAFYGACMAYGIIANFDFRKEDVQPIVAANEITAADEKLCYLSRSEEDIIKATNLATTLAYDKKIEENGFVFEDSIKPVIELFASKENVRLSTAAIWIMRANISSRQMDKVLESTIAMEVLLGDRETSDRIGLSKLMANRCAYALGKSSDERREIIDFFVKFYKLRSDIVHAGRFKVDEDEKKIVARGVDLASRILKHEVSLAK